MKIKVGDKIVPTRGIYTGVVLSVVSLGSFNNIWGRVEPGGKWIPRIDLILVIEGDCPITYEEYLLKEFLK